MNSFDQKVLDNVARVIYGEDNWKGFKKKHSAFDSLLIEQATETSRLEAVRIVEEKLVESRKSLIMSDAGTRTELIFSTLVIAYEEIISRLGGEGKGE